MYITVKIINPVNGKSFVKSVTKPYLNYDDLKQTIRNKYGLTGDFYFTDENSKCNEIAIDSQNSLDNYLNCLTPTECPIITLIIRFPNRTRVIGQQTLESLQSMIERLELGMNDLRATIEKNVANKADVRVAEKQPSPIESIQSMIKSLELGLTNLQATVETTVNHALKSVENSVVGTAVKTAAEAAVAHVYRSFQTQFDVICNGCYLPIRGVSYHCETCDDFDLCSICKCVVDHNSAHNFRQDEQKAVIVVCDYCDSDIVGVRHTCRSCPDFDLCHPCFSIFKEKHAKDHEFITQLVGAQVQVKKEVADVVSSADSDEKPPAIQHLGVQCDHCQTDIENIRYKCGHCANFDLCERCEEESQSIHDKTHVFIKLRYPIQSIVKNPLLPKFKTLNRLPEMIEVNPKPAEAILVRQETSSASPVINATFMADLNIPDGTLVVPKKTFIKMWKVKNTGNVDWPVGTHLLFNGGAILRPYPMSRPDSFAVPSLTPGEDTCLTAELQAPDSPGLYTSFFCLCTPEGERFGDDLWCNIKVDEDNSDETVEKAMSEIGSEYSTSTLHTYTNSQVSSPTHSELYIYEVQEKTDGEEYQHTATEEEEVHETTEDEFVFIDDEKFSEEDANVNSIHSVNTVVPESTYQSQLLQLHEMGITAYDDLALSLLRLHNGALDKVMSKIVEYP
ncbi:MAG: hypothetical protein EXX96DRAFT_587015 [Benjaminiella poitrasii]|nr:MAG: hypothetical protein EXX96DRAFT_587015 [Benjaminiella poitrasii]